MSLQRKNFAAVIQARMSSNRLPGKILKPLAGRAILEHVFRATTEALPKESVIVATSTDPTDDNVESFCNDHGMRVFRGPLDNVVLRLQLALAELEAEAFFRICADSPFYDPQLMRLAMDLFQRKEADLVTNVFPRSFPKGRSIELARASTFLRLDARSLSRPEQEHVFSHYYEHPEKFTVENFSSPRDFSGVNLCIDTQDDWERSNAFLCGRSSSQPAFSFLSEELAEAFGEKKK
jgi:spore coat polysaccharide biosynthesis protein SpsF